MRKNSLVTINIVRVVTGQYFAIDFFVTIATILTWARVNTSWCLHRTIGGLGRSGESQVVPSRLPRSSSTIVEVHARQQGHHTVGALRHISTRHATMVTLATCAWLRQAIAVVDLSCSVQHDFFICTFCLFSYSLSN